MQTDGSETQDTQHDMAARFAALNRVGTALMRELDETRLLRLIAETACELTGASFAAFTLRPVNEEGQPLVPSEGELFHLAAVVGVSQEQEALFSRMSLGGEGLLAPIFRYGVPVLVADVLAHIPSHASHTRDDLEIARQIAFAYAHGQTSAETLRSMGIPHGHPVIRSFLGTPLLDRSQQVFGGLLLGHTDPDQFTLADEELLVGLAAQAAIAMENARLYRTAQMRAQQLDAIFESIADGVTLVNREGTILRENGPARRLREELQHNSAGEQTLQMLLHTPAQYALHGETKQGVNVTVSDKQNEIHEYLVNASPLHVPTSPLQQSEQKAVPPAEMLSGSVVVWHDVTESRRLLLERRGRLETESRRALLQMLLDELPSSVYLVRGQDARLVLANRAAETVWGVPWSVGMPMKRFLEDNGIRIFSIDGHPLKMEHLATLRAVQHGETVHHHQEIIRHRDGTTLPVLVNAVALDMNTMNKLPADAMKQIVEESDSVALVMHQDVTPLKEAEKLKDDFIGIAAHELRTPLAILKGSAQTLIVQTARGKGPELADWQMESLQGIDQATVRLIELTEDLLDVTRLQAGQLALHYVPTDLISLSKRVIARLRITAEKHSITFLPSTDHLVASVDPRRMEQVLSNIIGNALKYSPQGGSIEVSIHEDLRMHEVLLTIRDHGIGIPAHQQASIFGRFMRADNARARGIGGTGLGLYLCRELIERHGGRIWFESAAVEDRQDREGTTFFIALPIFDSNMSDEP